MSVCGRVYNLPNVGALSDPAAHPRTKIDIIYGGVAVMLPLLFEEAEQIEYSALLVLDHEQTTEIFDATVLWLLAPFVGGNLQQAVGHAGNQVPSSARRLGR